MRVGAGKEDEDMGPYFLQTEEMYLTRAHFQKMHRGATECLSETWGEGGEDSSAGLFRQIQNLYQCSGAAASR